MNCIVGVDIGGTEIKLGKFIDGKLIKKYSIKTIDGKGSQIVDQLCSYIKDEVLEKDTLIGMGIGVPSAVKNGIVLITPNLGWKNYDIKRDIIKHFPNIKIEIGNDANFAALGEKANGSAQQYNSYCFVTLGTGIGGGIIINGKVLEGTHGAGGEIGHINSVVNGRACGCGLHGCIERYASATGILQTAKEQIALNPNSKLNQENLTTKIIFDCAKEKDELAVSIVEDAMEKLALVLSQIASTINPEVFIIGGGVSKAGQYLIDILTKKFQKVAFPAVKSTPIILASLGNDAGIYGASYACSSL